MKGDSKGRRAARLKQLAKQSEIYRSTGFAGGNAELGHHVTYELRARRFSEAVAVFGGHLAAIAGCFNFQGNARIAKLMRRSLRTIQRCRALLEAEGLITSCLLEPGQMVDKQRSPVWRAQVVRDVSALQRLAFARSAQRNPRRGKKHDNTKAAAAVAVKPITSAELEELAANAPDFLQGIIADAASGKREAEKYEPKVAIDDVPAVTAEQLDAIDLELQQLSEQQRAPRERPPDKPRR